MFNFFGKKKKPTGKVSILIPTIFDSRYMVELCIRSILKHTAYPDYQIIVGNSGVDQKTFDYLSNLEAKGTIKLYKMIDGERPKDELVQLVDTEYYMFMHDDIKITDQNWLENRLKLINKSEDVAIVGAVVKNSWNHKGMRFFPLGLLARTEVSRQLNLKWGRQRPDFDTGSLAYNAFIEQDRYKFINYKISKGIYHFAEMSWPRSAHHMDDPKMDGKRREREEKIQMIRDMLDRDAF